jgi:putative holliday junction resolvase
LGRILALDVGEKRTGLAVTDPLKLIANNLGTVKSDKVIEFIKEYLKKEEIELFVVGLPKQLNNEYSQSINYIDFFLQKMNKQFPQIPVTFIDERFTSKLAFKTMIDAGISKKARRNKELVDSISATIILQSYLETLKNKV